MKITRRQLRRIVKEGLTQSQRATAAYAAQHRREHGRKGWRETENPTFSLEDIWNWLEGQYEEYKKDQALSPEAIQLLLMDDFMDDLGADHEMTPEIKDMIDDLAGISRGR